MNKLTDLQKLACNFVPCLLMLSNIESEELEGLIEGQLEVCRRILGNDIFSSLIKSVETGEDPPEWLEEQVADFNESMLDCMEEDEIN